MLWVSVILLVSGLLLGLLIGLRGWLNAGGLIAIASSLATFVMSLVKDVFFKSEGAVEKVHTSIQAARAMHLDVLLPTVATGFLCGLVLTMVIAAGLVFVANLKRLQRERNVDAWGLAGRRATYVLVHGVSTYLSAFSEDARNANVLWADRWLVMNQMFLNNIRSCCSGTGLGVERFREIVQGIGTLFLTSLFEASGTLSDFRLAIYKVSADQAHFEPFILVHKGDWTAHKNEPLAVESSFMGQAWKEGRPRIYPREKKLIGGKFIKRGKSRYRSFIAVPLPPDPNVQPRWGVLTIDYTGKDQVFGPSRIGAAGDFARFVDIMYTHLKSETS